MTWYYNISDDGSSMDIYEDDAEFTGKIATIQNDGNGFRTPDDVLVTMTETFMGITELGQNPTIPIRAGWIVTDLTTNNIKQGVPPSLK